MDTKQGFEIDVKGEAEILLPAERAVLSICLNTQGLKKTKVTDGIVTSARRVEVLLREISTSKEGQTAAVDYWSRTALSKTSRVRWDANKKVDLPREYSASVDFQIRLQKYNSLGRIIHDLIAIEHTAEAQRSKLRISAARNALNKVQDYAQALGYDKVVPLELKEAQAYTRSSSRKGGLVPTDGVETQSKNMVGAEEWEDVGDEAFQYTPEEVKMSQSVNAGFRAE